MPFRLFALDTTGSFFMRWYNAAMRKPFQFSIRRMLCAATLFCAGAWLLAMTQYVGRFGGLRLLAVYFLVFWSVMGAAIGCLFGKPSVGALIGALVGFMLLPVASFWTTKYSDL